MAVVVVSFDAWKGAKVAPTKHEVAIVLPKKLNFKLADVSRGIRRELIHLNKTSDLGDVRFSGDGKRLIAGDYPGGVVAVWDVESGKRTTTIETGYGYRGSLHYFSVTPDWYALYVSRPGKNKIDRVEMNGKPMNRWEFDGAVRSWELATGKLLKILQHDPPRYLNHGLLSPDGNYFLTSEELPGTHEKHPPRSVSLWNTRNGKYIDLGKNIDTYGVFSPDSRLLACSTVNSDGHATALTLLDTTTGKPNLTIPVKEPNAWVSVSKFSPDGQFILVGYQVFDKAKDWKSFQYRFEVLETTTGKVVASLAAPKNEGLPAYFSPDGRTLVANNWRGKEPKLLLFSVPENRVLKTIILGNETKGERLIAGEPAFRPDGKRLAIVTQIFPDTRDDDIDARDMPQPRVHLIDVSSGEIRTTLVAPQSFSRNVCFSPDGQSLAVGSHGRVLLWDVSNLGK
jgi:WD40 repeat protein